VTSDAGENKCPDHTTENPSHGNGVVNMAFAGTPVRVKGDSKPHEKLTIKSIRQEYGLDSKSVKP
jgi:hypothetical protein